ncbi:MAG: hypothetical protein PHW12_07760, partial [Smithella sp.]|nr:hypothetical protein [Smithella sp.]
MKTQRPLLSSLGSQLTARHSLLKGSRLAARSFLVLAVSLLTASAAHAQGTGVNYDTAWTFVYDGGTFTTGLKGPVQDIFYDVKPLPGGGCICAGKSSLVDTNAGGDLFLLKLDSTGKLVWKKLYRNGWDGGGGHSIVIAKNGDFIIGGERNANPWVMRLDSATLNVKWANWYYDSVADHSLLLGPGVINCIKETSRGEIVCAAGNVYPFNNYQPFSNYACYIEYDSAGKRQRPREWNMVTNFDLGGFYIDEGLAGHFFLSGRQGVQYLDTNGAQIWVKSYGYMLEGVGSELANVSRVKVLRNGTVMA